MIEVAEKAYAAKIDGLFWLKHQFVRTRAYQASMLLEHHEFKSRTSRLALHSSCNSGHCVEGILFSCAIADAWLNDDRMPDVARVASLKQYAVDFGDRRVFAGVHYPSDNIASWFLALEIIPHIFRNPDEMTDFALDAILNYSSIFHPIKQNYPQKQELRPAVDLLETALGRSLS